MDCKNLIVERAHSSRRAEGALRVHRPHLRQRVELPVLAETVPARLQGVDEGGVIKRAAAMHTQGAPQAHTTGWRSEQDAGGKHGGQGGSRGGPR